MNRRFFAILLLSAFAASMTLAQPAGLTVTATYRGKGTVSEKNKIFVFLFDHPNPTANSQPLGMQMITRNGGSAVFTGLSQPAVYIVLVYDPSGAYDGRGGPPAIGSPWGVHSKAGVPVKVEPAKTRKVMAVLTDAQKWGTPAPAPAKR